MRKALSLLLVLIFVVSLAGCGGSAKEAEPQQETATPTPDPAILLYEKYSDIISALEEENYDGAVSLIEEMKPTPEVPPIKEVIITTDNFFDYFEFIRINSRDLTSKDSQGNIKTLVRLVRYILKPEYSVAQERLSDCAVEVGVTYDEVAYVGSISPIDVDFDSFTFSTFQEPIIEHEDKMIHADYFSNNNQYRMTIGSEHLSTEYVDLIENIELVSVSGTIYIYE